MRLKLSLFLLIWLLALAGASQEAKKTSIAIYPIRAVGEVNKSFGPTLTSLMGYELNQSSKLLVIDESALKVVMERQAMNISDLCDDTVCQVEIGKLVQAQKMVAGDLSKLGANYILTLKVIDVQSGTMETTTKDKCACTDDQLEQLVAAAGARIRNHFGEALPIPKLPLASNTSGLTTPPSSRTPPASSSSPPPGVTALPDNFLRALKGGEIQTIQTLLTQDPSLLNAQNENGTALHLAATYGYPEIAKFLIAKGANVNARTNTYVREFGGMKIESGGDTPLHSASMQGNKEVCEILLAGGADVNAKNASGLTPLSFADFSKHKEVMDLLRQHGGKKGKFSYEGKPSFARPPKRIE